MSERGSFVTQYIHCPKCLEVVKNYLENHIDKGKFLHTQQILSWDSKEEYLPILAGKIGGRYSGEEINFMQEIVWELEELICHPVRIAVIADHGQKIITAKPRRIKTRNEKPPKV